VLRLPASTRIFLCATVADMRRSFDGLACMTREVIGLDPLTGHLFVFRNRRGDRMKILWWDGDGLALFYKRLERGTFQFPAPSADGSVEIDAATLAMIFDGVDTTTVKRRTRFSLKKRVHPLDNARDDVIMAS
jgi:transposase